MILEFAEPKPGNERKIFILSVSDEERSKRLRECFDFQWVELSLSLLLGPSFPQKVEQTPVLAAIRQIHIKKSEKKKIPLTHRRTRRAWRTEAPTDTSLHHQSSCRRPCSRVQAASWRLANHKNPLGFRVALERAKGKERNRERARNDNRSNTQNPC